MIRSTDRDQILGEMFATDLDQIVIRATDGTKLGWFLLIYGNSGFDVVSDHSANPICDEIWETVIEPLTEDLA